MKTKLFQVYDRVAQQLIGPIWLSSRKEAAARDFREWLDDERSKLGGHKADYELWQLAELDTETGNIKDNSELDGAYLTQPDFICRGEES